jgi:hypothetical protein
LTHASHVVSLPAIAEEPASHAAVVPEPAMHAPQVAVTVLAPASEEEPGTQAVET